MNSVEIFSEVKRFRGREHILKKIVQMSLFFMKKDRCDFQVYVLKSSSMKRVSRVSRGKDSPTTILSFCADDFFPHLKKKKEKPLYFGEIYISPKEIEKKGESIERYLVHGILHLLGYTHGTRRDMIKMESFEEKILNFLSQKKII